MASPTLALPTAGGTRPRGVLTMAVLFITIGGALLFGALIAAYLHLRRLEHQFPPGDAKIDQYWGNLMVLTMVMTAVTVEWGCAALRRGERKQALAGFGITLAMGIAFLNLMSFAAGRVKFDAVSHPYGLVVTAMCMLLGIAVGVGVGFVALTLFRISGRQLLGPDAEQPRAAAVYWHFTVLASVAVWYTVIVLK